MFEAETRSVILERLKKYYAEFKGTDVSAVEGTFSFDTLAANAKEFEKAYAEMDLMMDAAFPQTSWGIYLDRLADELAGLSRRAATPAVVTLSITGTAGVTVPAGSLFATASGTNFATDETVKLDDNGTGTVKATAQSTGAGGNVAAGSITVIPVSIYGVSKVTNEAAAYNGAGGQARSSALKALVRAEVRKIVRNSSVALYYVAYPLIVTPVMLGFMLSSDSVKGLGDALAVLGDATSATAGIGLTTFMLLAVVCVLSNKTAASAKGW